MKILNLLLFLLARNISQNWRLNAEAGKHFVNFMSFKKQKKLALFHFTLLKVSFSPYCFFLFLLYPFFQLVFISFLLLPFWEFVSCLLPHQYLSFFTFYFCFLPYSFYSTLKLFAYTVFCFISCYSPNHLFYSFIITASEL